MSLGAQVAVGSFLCDPSAPIRVGTRIQCRVVVFNVEVPLTRGFPLVLHYQSTSEQASVRRILSQLHKGTGEVVRHKPRSGRQCGFASGWPSSWHPRVCDT